MWLIDTGSFAVVVAYIFVPISFLVLRRRQPELVRPFEVRLPRLVGYAAIVLGVGLLCLFLPGSPSALVWPYEWVIVLIWAGFGGLVWFLRVRVRPNQVKKV